MIKNRLIASVSIAIASGITVSLTNNRVNAAEVKKADGIVNAEVDIADKNSYEDYGFCDTSDVNILDLKRVWLELHLQEYANRSFFNDGKEITKHLVKGVMEGKITAYRDENCTQAMSKDDFLVRLKDPNIVSNTDDQDFTSKKKGDKVDLPSEDELFRAKDICKMRLMVDLVTHDLYAEQFMLIKSITVTVPANKLPGGVDFDIATFNYIELIKYFETLDPNESYIDSTNMACNMKFSKALEISNLWFPQSYYVDSEEKRIKKHNSDKETLDLKKSEIISGEAYL